jgi:hypothetical protein
MRKLILALCLLAAPIPADEGMWLFNKFPAARVKEKYGFEVTQQFLDHLRLASVRMGASASFVSPHGLIFTNHHVALECVEKISTAEHNYVDNGYYAKSDAQELKCPDFEANILLQIDDVTPRVKAAVKAPAGSAEANQQRKAALTEIEKECTSKAGNKCSTVTLYSGALYQLLQYKKYTDIRLVFAPEADVGFFGGDPDNFTYPRYDLDIAFFRAYENGKPVETPNYLKWSREGVKEGELVFASGNPGRTDRLDTMAELDFQRDVRYPNVIERLKSTIAALEAFGAKNAEAARVSHDNLFGAQNSLKALTGEYKGLEDQALMDRRRKQEEALREAVNADPKLHSQYASAWDDLARAFQSERGFYKQYALFEGGAMFSDLFRIARNVYRLAEERTKPNPERQREYTDAALPSLEMQMYSPAPISDGMEIALLTTYFQQLEKYIGDSDPVVKQVLGGKSPQQAAQDYVASSKLKVIDERKRLAASVDAVKASNDPMIRLIRMIDPVARKYRKMYEDQVEAVKTASLAKIAQAEFAIHGADQYPDATFTLRMAYGPVKGYTENGSKIRWSTDFAGLFNRATGKDPYKLPERWLKAKASLDLNTPLDFVTTDDITGGNSGSPTVNEKGEIIGIVFDGNLEELPNNFIYDDVEARAIHVASQGIVEALKKVYHASRVLKELNLEP